MAFFSLSPRLSSRGVSLYLGAFTKVVLFDGAKAAPTIRQFNYLLAMLFPSEN